MLTPTLYNAYPSFIGGSSQLQTESLQSLVVGYAKDEAPIVMQHVLLLCMAYDCLAQKILATAPSTTTHTVTTKHNSFRETSCQALPLYSEAFLYRCHFTRPPLRLRAPLRLLFRILSEVQSVVYSFKKRRGRKSIFGAKYACACARV